MTSQKIYHFLQVLLSYTLMFCLGFRSPADEVGQLLHKSHRSRGPIKQSLKCGQLDTNSVLYFNLYQSAPLFYGKICEIVEEIHIPT